MVRSDPVCMQAALHDPTALAGDSLPRHAKFRFFDVHALHGSDHWRASQQLQAWLERGLIRHRIAARPPLQRISEAHALVASGLALGKVLLAID